MKTIVSGAKNDGRRNIKRHVKILRDDSRGLLIFVAFIASLMVVAGGYGVYCAHQFFNINTAGFDNYTSEKMFCPASIAIGAFYDSFVTLGLGVTMAVFLPFIRMHCFSLASIWSMLAATGLLHTIYNFMSTQNSGGFACEVFRFIYFGGAVVLPCFGIICMYHFCDVIRALFILDQLLPETKQVAAVVAGKPEKV